MSTETRSESAAGGQLELFMGLPMPPASPPAAQGVGGRQAPRPPPGGGGGYLDECTPPELPSDPRFRELAEIGLAPVWLQAAQALGFDRWIELWRMLSADDRVLTDDRQIVLRLRDFGWYEKLQRDLYIRRLHSLGVPLAEIVGMVHRHLGDNSSQSSIGKVTKTSWAARRRVAQLADGLSPYLIDRIRREASRSPDLFPVALEHALMAEACKASPKQRTAANVDPRLEELADIRMATIWRDVARLVGYDDFVALWRRWSANPALRTNDNLIELRLRNVRSFEKYQRNRYVETLVHSGLKPSQIRSLLRRQLGEELSVRHLMRLAAAGRVPE